MYVPCKKPYGNIHALLLAPVLAISIPSFSCSAKVENAASNMLREVLELSGRIGAAENYTLIIDKGGILYSDKNLDITDPFTKEYDELKEADKLKTGTQPEK